ncbi:hypothetical protein ACP4OV_013380 [Aristida adscensionis]
MGKLAERLRAFFRNRWLVFVAATWVQSMAGIGYLFGAISPVLKEALGYNQRQVAVLGVAKNLGDAVGFLAATLPPWGLLSIGAAHSLVGYGWLWLIVTRQAPALPLWMMCNWGSGDCTYPRHIALAIAQTLMAVGHFLFAMAWPGTLYIGTFLVGLGYGAHWAIVPAAISELFGIKHFGAMYNFLTVANPTGSLIFSSLIASNLYDYEAEKQAHHRQNSALLRDMGFLAEGPLKCEGAVCFFVSSLIMSAVCVVGAGSQDQTGLCSTLSICADMKLPWM